MAGRLKVKWDDSLRSKMINKQTQLQNRGYTPIGIEAKFAHFPFNEKIKLLESKRATHRTIAARLLKDSKTKETVSRLINALKTEEKLYSKIEICNTLVAMNELAIDPLIAQLGEIGNNQHKVIPEKAFLKDSYPLPRDISSRTLIRIGVCAFQPLMNHIHRENQTFLSELIDTIGHINYNSRQENVYQALLDCYERNESDDLIKWKIIRAFSGVYESQSFLKSLLKSTENKRLKKEVERSLRLIQKMQLKNHKRF